MMGELYLCCDERRRAALRAGATQGSTLNGIDFLEVRAIPGMGAAGEQRELRVALVNPRSPALQAALVPPSGPPPVTVEGGEQVRGIRVASVAWGAAPTDLVVRVDRRGDFSTYTLRIGDADGRALPGMDLLLSAVDFSFKAECPAPGDCLPGCDCPPGTHAEPEIDYLARDYASFRQLMLDRMALVLPEWKERSPADLGVALVEVLAYVGDYLSWQQDAVATEAYLGTARRRTSVRRHARLLDYPMHDGCNARAWVQVELGLAPGGVDPALPLPAGTEVLTRVPGRPRVLAPGSLERREALLEGPEVFQTLHPVELRAAHNRIPFWSWGQRECCLPRGATRATLAGTFPDLRPGHVLVLEEVVGPETGAEADADPAHRHAVRLTRVETQERDQDGVETGVVLRDPVFMHLRPTTGGHTLVLAAGGSRPLAQDEVLEVLVPWDGTVVGSSRRWNVRDAAGREGTLTAPPAAVDRASPAITQVEWHRDDALPFALCLSSTTATERGGRHVEPVSVARGNVVLADHGLAVRDEPLGTPREGDPRLAPAGGEACGGGGEGTQAPPGRIRPRLREGPLTLATRVRRPAGAPPGTDHFFDGGASATAARRTDPARALPVLWVEGEMEGGPPWRPRRDLLASGPFARDLVAEVDDDGRAELRFGDDALGERPAAGVPLLATYRVGSGTAGNVGRDALAHLVSAVPGVDRVERVRNPLAAVGGTDPEPVERVRQVAPTAFRTVERAVTPHDYARMAERHPQVQRAEATLRWTGSWRTVFLTVDRAGGLPVDAEFEAELRAHLERYRMAGHDLEIDAPRWVPLEVEVFACVEPAYFRGDVERALRRVLGSRDLPDGSRGFFHPDHFTFGQGVQLSRIYAAAQSVAGLNRLEVRRFRRQNQAWTEK
ncbi:MAG TPA: putative baseplate assembly protein, partial [Longimicrobium sp.]|nr:putative baseplate assembly protein [Longimicrobium sp.]